jgi:hypothetical protein
MQLFLSHASEDKSSAVFQRALRRLHDRYCRTGDAHNEFTLWLDKPDQVPGMHLQKCVGRIQYSRDYRDEIRSALNRFDCCIIFFLSARALKKIRTGSSNAGELRWEVEQGFQRPDRFWGVVIDDTDPGELPAEFRHLQFCNLSDLDKTESHPAFDQLLEQIDSTVRTIRTVRPASAIAADLKARSRSESVDEALILRVDRTTQADSFERTLEGIKTFGGARPFIVSGPDDELPGKFLDRCWADASKALGGEPCAQHFIAWPKPASFRADYLRALSRHYFQHGAATEHQVAERIRCEKGVTAFWSRIYASQWNEHGARSVKEWLDLWTDLDRIGEGLLTLPLLCVSFEPAVKSWRNCPPTPLGQAPTNKFVLGELARVIGNSGKATDRCKAEIAPILTPFGRKEATDWLDELRSGVNRLAHLNELVADAEFEIPRLFPLTRNWLMFGRLEEKLVSMRMFKETMQRHFTKMDRPADIR